MIPIPIFIIVCIIAVGVAYMALKLNDENAVLKRDRRYHEGRMATTQSLYDSIKDSNWYLRSQIAVLKGERPPDENVPDPGEVDVKSIIP